MLRPLFFFVIFVFLAIHVSATPGQCTMMNTGFYNKSDSSYPVIPYTQPILLPQKHRDILAGLCDNLNVDGPVCCNTTQIDKMTENFFLIDVSLYRCRACVLNFKRLWCSFTCSPDQSEFVTIKDYWPAPWDAYVKTVLFDISMDFQNAFWDSCKDNVMGTVTVKNQYPTVRDFLRDLVSQKKSNPTVEFSFKDDSTGLKEDLVPCEQMCYCAYCSAACNSKPPLNPDYTCRIGTLACWMFATILGSVLAAAVLISVLYAIVQRSVHWYRNLHAMPVQSTTRNDAFGEMSSLLH
jgi:Niemann-Pick C1 protein